ncbi:hypothetical protein [Pseudonocardia sp. NPDC049154]|uniref:hypothetical protein n=1 Tax=Pseudonocardia sp. NPDC049154 TaxID=3155501 RepID=UPI00340A161D
MLGLSLLTVTQHPEQRAVLEAADARGVAKAVEELRSKEELVATVVRIGFDTWPPPCASNGPLRTGTRSRACAPSTSPTPASCTGGPA